MVSAGVVPTPAIAYLRAPTASTPASSSPRRTIRTRTTASRCSAARGKKLDARLEERDVERLVADPSWKVPPARPRRVDRSRAGGALRRAPARDPDERRAAGRRAHRRSTAPTAPPRTIAPALFQRARIRRRRHRRRAGRPQHQSRLRLDAPRRCCRRGGRVAARASVWRSTATAIARCSSITHGQSRRRRRDAADLRRSAAAAIGRLPGHAVVATVMSNIGLELALRDRGIELMRTAVGDKYVMEEMVKRGFALGGEQSGHVIFADHLFTGDGLATALNVLRIMADTGRGAWPSSPAALVTLSAGAGQRARARARRLSTTSRRSPRRCSEVEDAPRRPRPAAGALLGHRAAAADHARRKRSRRDPALGRRDRRRRPSTWR